MNNERGPGVHVSITSMDGKPPAEPIGWTTYENGEHVADGTDWHPVSEDLVRLAEIVDEALTEVLGRPLQSQAAVAYVIATRILERWEVDEPLPVDSHDSEYDR